ncbi:hypothetical protein L1987_20786 [Smallanthus sonchifolius]|uniref:Uncharacterized protein n=1 Tax=Smallanthus sonchifolius TaxID=185202 RepID=A0ACB9IUK9_9ASTR|nr:hypothetical protein L1987_20786 [Smallanthus sonchifolius]
MLISTKSSLGIVPPAYFKNYPENGFEAYPNNRRWRNNYSNTRRLSIGNTYRAQREDSVRRTGELFLSLISITKSLKNNLLLSKFEAIADNCL